MAAKDYTFVEGMNDLYLAKKKKRDDGTMSQDRRPITEAEQMYIAEHFLRAYCERKNTDEVTVRCGNKLLFKMTLLDKTINE